MQEQTIFIEALEREDAAERAAYLEQACAGDTALRQRLERLLQRHRQADSFLDSPASPPTVTVDEPAVTERPGTLIGPYKLLKQIGEGGMGLVFVAEQQQPVRRRVALKIIKPGMDSRQVIARFEAERQALAMMDHANIAKIHDGGTTPEGRPYFVMELVKGTPITEYCDTHRLTTRQRLHLFLDVCHAVQHAHQKGIIHRDLKPSNVLVAVHDVAPVVKVIDFGIAKATGPQLTDKTLYTGHAQLVGTPLYMSPEQAGLSSLDVDTRSDVYSLGVLLYELLTGTTPFDQEAFRQAGFDEMRRIMREDEPPRPSTRLSTLAKAALSTVCVRRGVDPRRLGQQVRGELDWIVMKALDKDRNRRYETASAFAADVQRYLNDEPVEACPPAAGYRLRKFVRRNKGPVAAGVALAVLLVLGTVGTSIGLAWALRAERTASEAAVAEAQQRQAAEAQRDRADANVNLGLASLERIYDALEKRLPDDPFLMEEDRQLLVQLLDFYERFATGNRLDPAVRQQTAHAFWRVGLILDRLGHAAQAEDAFHRTLDLLKKSTAKDAEYHKAMARTHHSLGNVLLSSDRLDEAKRAFGEVKGILEELEDECRNQPDYRQAWAAYYQSQVRFLIQESEVRSISLDHRHAKALCQQVVNLLDQLVNEFPEQVKYERDLAGAHNLHGIILGRAKEFQEARKSFDRAVDLQKKWRSRFPRDPGIRSELGTTQRNLGLHFRKTGDLAAAREAYREAEREFNTLVNEFPNVPYFRSELGEVLQGLALTAVSANPAEARDLAARAFDQLKQASRSSLGSPALRRKMRSSLVLLALFQAELKQHAQASEAAAEMAKLADRAIDYETALHLQLACIGLAELDASLAAEKRQELVQTYGDRAIALMREAITKGVMSAQQLQERRDLAPLRSREDFEKLLRDLPPKS